MPQEFLNKKLAVAVLGSGGREHALAWHISQSPFCSEVVVMPGNDGMALGKSLTIEPCNPFDFDDLVLRLKKRKVNLVIVGPDDLLAAGVVDALEEEGFLVFGPSKEASRIESSKSFAKEVMVAANVSTAKSVELTSTDPDKLAQAVQALGGYPIVLKYDGLALGKGVRICVDENDGKIFLSEVFEKHVFKRKQDVELVLAEEFLTGHEVSVFAVCDGKNFSLLEPACDHKRLNEGNRGPNTGGMGAYSPVPWISSELKKRIENEVFAPVLSELSKRKTPFKGLLYAGLMVSGEKFWVIEFNARFGDPETQALMPRLKSDLLPVFFGVASGEFERHLEAHPIRWDERSCVNIVVASEGYPEAPIKGREIRAKSALDDETFVFYAGVKSGRTLETSGGRVFSISALGDSLEQASVLAQKQVDKFFFEGMHFRRDIGRVKSVF